jgi:hypothetical protein
MKAEGGIMSRLVRGVLLTGALGAALIARGYAADAAKCNFAGKEGDTPVSKACAKGGVPEAKKTMKDLVTKARKGGTKFQCDECHKDDQKYELTPDARDKFKKLLAAAGQQ